MKYLGRMNISIMDRVWRVYFCDGPTYKKYGPDGSKACACMATRTIHFDCSALRINDRVAVHELVHVYSFELLGHDTPVDNSVVSEEFFCNVFERRGEDILKKAKPITKKLMNFRKKLEKLEKSPRGTQG